MKEKKKDKLDSNQNKNCTLRKAQLTKWQAKPQNGRKYFQIISDKGLGYIIQNIYSEAEYIINSYKSIKQVIQFKNGQKTWTLISPKKPYKGLINTRKCAQHH